MYLEHKDSNRSGWRYTYKGSDLLAAAKRILEEYNVRENTSREHMAKLMRDPKVSPSAQEVTECKREIERVAMTAEECVVFVHEFARTPDREFHLSQGDVVFFGLPK